MATTFSVNGAMLALLLACGACAPALAHTSDGDADQAGAKGAPAGRTPGTRDARAYFTDLELVTHEGRKVRFYSDVLHGRTVLINVVYATCKDACPLLVHKLNQVRALLGERFGRDIFYVSITSDPEHDSPAALRAFAKEQEADLSGWTFLTGAKANVDQILKKLGQYSPDYQAHSTLFIAGNVPAKRWSKIRPDAPPAVIAERLKLLADGGRPGTPVAR